MAQTLIFRYFNPTQSPIAAISLNFSGDDPKKDLKKESKLSASKKESKLSPVKEESKLNAVYSKITETKACHQQDSKESNKPNDENCSKDTESILDTNDDSPIKQSKKRKRTAQIIESDDESSNEECLNELRCSIISTKSVHFQKKSKKENVEETASAGQETIECIPKRKTARKQIKISAPKVETKEFEIKSESTKDAAAEEVKRENDSIIKNDEPGSLNSKEIKQKGDITSAEEKPIHPFFGSKVKEFKDNGVKTTPKSAPSGVTYDPSKARYHPIDDACWKRGEKVPYLALAKTLEMIEGTSGRLKTIEMLSNFFRSVIVLSPDDLLYSVYLCLNRIAPEYEGIELGVGETLLMRAVAQATGRTVEKIKADVAICGDLGIVAESSRGNQKVMFAPPKLTVASVFQKFKEIAKMVGNSSMNKKIDKIQSLFVACRECEAKYIIRSLSGKLRIGLAEQSVLAAIARAAVLTPPNQTYPHEILDFSAKKSADAFKEHLDSQTLLLKTTYCECPNYDLVIPVLLEEGISALPERCQLQPGCPLKPMLAHPTNGVDEVLKRFDKNEFTCEFKYDGERAQIHMTETGEVKIFSRNQEDNTSKYPDIISRISKAMKETTKSFILDSEAVAWDCESKQILPFQVLSTRKKKNASEAEITVQVCIMAFDLIYLNGESLVKKPLKERREHLHSAFVEVENEFMFVTYCDGNSADTMQEFLDESKKGNCEGLMVKSLLVDASYEIAKRSHNWLKLKKDYLKGVGDTLDLVVIGGYYGKGKRKGVYGGFLLACYDDDNEEFQTICKLGTGFTEKELEAHSEFLKDKVIDAPKPYYRFDSTLKPDVWFEAVQIWEIKCADLSISPVHKAAAGIVDPEKGISLRFPRFLRIRDDKKKPEDATSANQVVQLYQNQDQVKNTKNVNGSSQEDYY